MRVLGWRRYGLLGALAAMAAATATQAHAQPRGDHTPSEAEACFSAAEQAQPLMKQRQLRAAQRYLEVCARESCPRAARTDCRAWLDDVGRSEPTLVFVAREERPTGESRAVEDVRVSVDGDVLVPARLTVSAVAVDPGVHTLRFEHAGFEPVEQRLDLREGERDREVDVVFRAPGPPVSVSTPPAYVPPRVRPEPAPEPPEVPSSRPAPAGVYALAGAGTVSLGLGVVMEAIGLSSRAHLTDTCKPSRSCAASDVSTARNQVMAGDIALGASALLFAGAAYVYFTRDPQPTAGSAGALRLRIAPSIGGIFAGVEGSL